MPTQLCANAAALASLAVSAATASFQRRSASASNLSSSVLCSASFWSSCSVHICSLRVRSSSFNRLFSKKILAAEVTCRFTACPAAPRSTPVHGSRSPADQAPGLTPPAQFARGGSPSSSLPGSPTATREGPRPRPPPRRPGKGTERGTTASASPTVAAKVVRRAARAPGPLLALAVYFGLVLGLGCSISFASPIGCSISNSASPTGCSISNSAYSPGCSISGCSPPSSPSSPPPPPPPGLGGCVSF